MRVFVSHAAVDRPVVTYLETAFAEVGVDTVNVGDHTGPGFAWLEAIRTGVHECDEAVVLLTPEALGRPWIVAEWACFWLLEKRATVLLAGVGIDQVWQPMTAFQHVDLFEPRSVSSLLRRWADISGRMPVSGVQPKAAEIVRESAEIVARQRVQHVEAVLTRVTANLSAGTDNVKADDVRMLIDADRVAALVDLTTSSTATNVKKRQVAQELVAAGRLGEALVIARSIDNRAESRSVALTVVDSMAPAALPESEEWQFLIGIHEHLAKPQRRDVRARLLTRGIEPIDCWREDGAAG